MTPDQIVLVQESFEQLLPMADATADGFYTRLFAAHPPLRALFTADPAEQRHKFLVSLHAIVEALWRPEDLAGPLQALGARHAGYGVRPEHYVPVGEALVGAICDQLGPACGPEVEAAWRAAYGMVAAVMVGASLAHEQVG